MTFVAVHTMVCKQREDSKEGRQEQYRATNRALRLL
jgi:hypothetical protein